jgi:hypothetical protein
MTEVFELVYHGGGGFSYSEVWHMPVPHRRFNLKKINEHLEKVEELKNKGSEKLTDKTDPKTMVQIPDHVNKASQKEPTYVSKVKSKK